jgi:hypothetical protein
LQGRSQRFESAYLHLVKPKSSLKRQKLEKVEKSSRSKRRTSGAVPAGEKPARNHENYIAKNRKSKATVEQ